VSLESPPTAAAQRGKGLLTTVLVTAILAAIVLVAVILPAEYNVDPTGIGRMLGLTSLNESSSRTIQIRDVIGGNESLREVEVPDAGEPTPLPNPAVYQEQDAAPQTRTMTIQIPAVRGTEVKTVLQEAKVIVFSWKVDGGQSVQVDFHGHDPSIGEGFVRYRLDDETSSGRGSLVAPFGGEHGWYWLNYNTEPISITLTVTGYFDDIVDYGIL
jgi:hypothetical protein